MDMLSIRSMRVECIHIGFCGELRRQVHFTPIQPYKAHTRWKLPIGCNLPICGRAVLFMVSRPFPRSLRRQSS